ncbi:hypothetical protein D9M68_959700 [compost metagenome]
MAQAKQLGHRSARQGVERRGIGDPFPEAAQAGAGTFAATFHQPGGQRHRVHGARAGATDGRDLQPLLFQQAVEHAPGEGAV